MLLVTRQRRLAPIARHFQRQPKFITREPFCRQLRARSQSRRRLAIFRRWQSRYRILTIEHDADMMRTKPDQAGAARTAPRRVEEDVSSALDWLKHRGTRAGRDTVARYGIRTDRAFGVAMRDIQALAKRLGRRHDLAAALWSTGWYEARLLAAYVDEPARVTPAQMDRWCRDFDNWAVVDTVSFALFDRTPHAWPMVKRWANRRDEFEKRAAFALLWGLSVHDKTANDRRFVEGLALIERAASDDRHFVKKAVNMALRAVGKRRPTLHLAAVAVATRLAASQHSAARWVGKDALRELTSSSVARRLAAQRSRTARPHTRL